MSSAETLKTVKANIKTALKEIEKEITPGVNDIYTYSRIQTVFPYWSNRFSGVAPVKIATQQWRYTYTVQAAYNYAGVNEGIDGEKEEDLSDVMDVVAVLFQERNKLQCATFRQGVPSLDPAGISVTAQMAIIGLSGAQTRAVLATLTIPVLARIETGR
jgi:hypothetical protein